MNSHSSTCNFNDMELAKAETKLGFVSRFRFVCEKCLYIHILETSVQRDDKFGLNYESVLAAMCIGIGFSQLEQFTGIMNVPCPTLSTYRRIANKVQEDVITAADASTETAAAVEKQIAVEMGSVDQNGTPKVKVIVDAAWSKRSYRTNYSALSGSAVIIGHNSNKVLWQGVANKYCSICQTIKSGKKEYYDHECNVNYSGPSTGMESNLIVDGFRFCDDYHHFRIHEMIGDGDSSVITEIHKANIYQNPTMKCIKTECCNHLYRNCRGCLRKLGEKGFLKHFLTPGKSEEIIKDIRCARKHWDEKNVPVDEKIQKLRLDIYNIPFHVFGDHSNCADYFCKKKKANEINHVPTMKANNSFNDILDALARIRLNARSILLNENGNPAEHFNSLIVKFTGGKRVNFSAKQSFTARCKLAVLQYNTGRAYTSICHHINKIPNELASNIEFKRCVKTLWHSNNIRPYQQKTKCSGVDKNYGNLSCAKPDMDERNYLFEREKFVENLKVNQATRSEIERKTTKQHGNSDWIQYRVNMITASNFGRICNARSPPESYAGIINSMLYTDISHLKQIAHGSFYERNALKKLEEAEGIKIKECGLFIDAEFPFLGATPDGLVGEDAIVEVKCPQSIYERDIDESILNGKLAEE